MLLRVMWSFKIHNRKERIESLQTFRIYKIISMINSHRNNLFVSKKDPLLFFKLKELCVANKLFQFPPDQNMVIPSLKKDQ